jgi:hypothetical protein
METNNSIMHRVKYISLALITLGVVFKTNHWEGASALIIAGGLSLSAVFIIAALANRK